MTKEPAPDAKTTLSRGERLALVIFAAPVIGGGSFAAIAFLSDLMGASLYGASEWGVISWGFAELFACVLLILAVVLVETTRVGSLATYAVAGAAAGTLSFLLSDWSSL